jgi:long-chain acyl-CoA synthetase
MEKKSKLVALVHFNREEIKVQQHHLKEENADYLEHEIEKLRIELLAYVNHHVNKFSQIQEVIVMPEPFEKTATQKIKRYLYA